MNFVAPENRYTPESFPPRKIGWNTALNLNRGINDNPYSPEAIKTPATAEQPETILSGDDPGHPHREWREGFIRSRIMLNKQTAANVAIGKGLVLMYRAAPSDTLKTICQMGRSGAEFIAMALLVAAMDTAGVEVDTADPIAIGVIYGAMKARINRREIGVCYSPEHLELAAAAYEIGGFLETVFQRQPAELAVKCQIGGLKFALDRLLELDNRDNAEIHSSPTAPEGEPTSYGLDDPFCHSTPRMEPEPNDPISHTPPPQPIDDPISHDPPPGPLVDPINPT